MQIEMNIKILQIYIENMLSEILMNEQTIN